MDNYCITCHSGKKPAADFALTSYEAVRFQTEKGPLLDRINSFESPMPQGGLMRKELRVAIEQWAKNGFKRNGKDTSAITNHMDAIEFKAPDIVPVDLNTQGFEFFDLMPGHWVGDMVIMGKQYDWFSFDYRPISPAHIHGIYEGGTMGNLFTSFFISHFKGKKTIMARNGGILNGTYRTSYFVLDKVELSANRKYFRLIDAYGGKDIMFMELEFIGDNLNFNSYVSRFGLNGKPKLHMQFKASRKHPAISEKVAKELGYPQNEVAIDFSQGLPVPDWGNQYAVITSASYIYQDNGEGLATLAKLSGDPYTLEDMPHVAAVTVEIEQNAKTKDKKLIIYLSQAPLTDAEGKIIMEYGFIKPSLFDGVLSFPEISPNQTTFTFTYLHPGDYYLTVVADLNEDGYISKGDLTSKPIFVSVSPGSEQTVRVENLLTKN